MAVYFTFAIECYDEKTALRLSERLRTHVVETEGHEVPMARVNVSKEETLWYVWATPRGPGYCDTGYGEGLNEPAVVSAIVENLYEVILNNAGVRRAMCGYEGQDAFLEAYGNPGLNDCHEPNLVYHMQLGPPQTGAREFGTLHYRNSKLFGHFQT